MRLAFRTERAAKAIGALATTAPRAGDRLSGVLVSQGFTQHLMAPKDVPTYTQLAVSTLEQQQHCP